jgi:hypothetical protein
MVNSANPAIAKATLVILLFTVFFDSKSQTYSHYKSIDINNTTGTTLTNHQVLVIFDSQTEINASKLQSTCADIRFTTSLASSAYLTHWIERGCNTSSTRVWVKIPSLPAGITTIYMLHNNPTASDASDGDNTFIFFDDFSSGSLSASKWELKKGSVQSSGGDLPTGQYCQNDNTVSSAFGQLRINSTNYPLPSENYALHFSFYDPGSVSGSRNIWGGFANAASTTPTDYLIAGLPTLDNTVIHYWYYVKTNSTAVSANYLTGGAGVSTATRTNSWNQVELYRRANSFTTTDFLTIRYGGNITSVPSWFASGVTPSYVALYSTSYAAAFDNVFIRKYVYPDPTVTIGSSILPIKLAKFEVELKNGVDAELHWTTTTEALNNGFEIQKSADGKTFSKIGFVKGSGSINENHNYDFVDHDVAGRVYYRLKQEDMDGTFTLSNIQVVFAKQDDGKRFYVTCGGADEPPQFHVVGLSDDISLRATLINTHGQSFEQYSGSIGDINNQFSNDFRNLPRGQYIALVEGQGRRFHSRFIKQ